MTKRSKFDAVTLRQLPPGGWVWEGGVGYRRDKKGDGGSWYVKYRAPIDGNFPAGVKPPMRQVKERLPNCRNKSQAEGVLMTRKAAIFEGTYQARRRAVPTTIADFAPDFLQAKRHLRTIRKYRQQIEQYLAPHFGRKPIEAINGRDCLDYYNMRLDSSSAVSTVNGDGVPEIAVLRGDPRRHLSGKSGQGHQVDQPQQCP